MTDTVIKPPWLPEGLYQEWLTAYTEAGGAGVSGAEAMATEVVRNSPNYDSYFPGLRRDDGSLRYSYQPEATYFNNIASFKNAVSGVGVNPDLLTDRYVDLIRGDTSPQEFAQRVNTLYDRIEMGAASSEIRNWYAANYSLDMTDSGILASLMDPEGLGQSILERRISMAEIGGEAASRNFDLTTKFVDLLEAEGMNRAEADALFGSAERMLPMLQTLAKRHNDTDDTFDITEFAGAGYLQDAEQQKRIQRLTAQERSLFGSGSSFQRNQQGALTGLVAE